MAKKFIQLQEHPSAMSEHQLRAALAEAKDSEVMRSLILAEVEAIRNGSAREHRTMRSLWYTLVKPALSRAGLLNKTTASGNPVDWAGKLSQYLAELVRMGLTSYEELHIIDGSRQRQLAVAMTRPVADVRLVGPHFPWVILFTEKDTIWGEVASVASLYGVSAISGGGFPSYACTENMVKAITQSEAYKKQQPGEMVLLALTDFDPMGYGIAEAQHSQLLDAVNATFHQSYNFVSIRHVRLGLEPEQLTPDERQRNAYDPKRRGLDEWYTETGGVDGQPLGLELDALPLSRVRLMFAEGTEQWIDLDKRREDIRDAFLDGLACELLRPDFDEKRQELGTGVKNSELWTEILKAPLPDGLFRRAAAQGYHAIDPLVAELFDCEDEVRDAMVAGLG